MDSDIKKVLELDEEMMKLLRRLEARQTFTDSQQKAVAAVANTYRFLLRTDMSLLQAEFDPAYAAELKELNKKVCDFRKNNERLN